VLRFAPSPNGELHLGHALSALTNAALAERLGGRLLLRIEDIDITRTRPEFVAGIFEDLRWLGVSWEEPVLRQSEHLADYAAAADLLASEGLLYPCFATRAEIAAAADPTRVDPDGAPIYPGLHRSLAKGEIDRRRAAGQPSCMRLDMQRAMARAADRLGGRPLRFTELGEDLAPVTIPADPARWGDVILQRKEVATSYHLSVVVDDARQGVTHVVRGRDLYAATDLHRLLHVLLGLPEPVYHHHRLITDPAGRKLAKRARDTSLRQLRDQGITPAAVRERLGIFPGDR
jgi:glutamyl-Q tRNA(Asp) synthetase